MPPGAIVAAPVGDPSTTPLALDEAPSFVTPAAWSVPMAYGLPGIAAPVGSDAGIGPDTGGFPGAPTIPGGGPIVGTSSTPPPGVGEPPPAISTSVPEPQTWALMLVGLAALAGLRRRSVKT